MKCGGGAGEYRRLKDQVKAVGKLTTHGKLPSRAQSLLLTSLSGLSPPPARKPANYSARQPAPQVLALIPGTFLLWSPYLLSQDFQQCPPPHSPKSHHQASPTPSPLYPSLPAPQISSVTPASPSPLTSSRQHLGAQICSLVLAPHWLPRIPLYTDHLLS